MRNDLLFFLMKIREKCPKECLKRMCMMKTCLIVSVVYTNCNVVANCQIIEVIVHKLHDMHLQQMDIGIFKCLKRRDIKGEKNDGEIDCMK